MDPILLSVENDKLLRMIEFNRSKLTFSGKAALREPSGLIHKNHQVFIVMNAIDLNLEQPILAVSLSNSFAVGRSIPSIAMMIFFLFFFLLISQKPFSCDVEHRVGVSCVGGGVIKCNVSIDRAGFVPGKFPIPIYFEFHLFFILSITRRFTRRKYISVSICC